MQARSVVSAAAGTKPPWQCSLAGLEVAVSHGSFLPKPWAPPPSGCAPHALGTGAALGPYAGIGGVQWGCFRDSACALCSHVCLRACLRACLHPGQLRPTVEAEPEAGPAKLSSKCKSSIRAAVFMLRCKWELPVCYFCLCTYLSMRSGVHVYMCDAGCAFGREKICI